VAGKRGRLWKVGRGKRGDVRGDMWVRVGGGEVRGAEVRGLERDFERGLEREVGNLREGRTLLGAGVTGEMASRSSRPATAN